MTRRRLYTRRWLADLCFFGLLHSLLAVALQLLAGGSLAASLILALPCAGMVLVRERVDSLALFLLFHLALAACPAALPIPAPYRAAAVVLLACFGARSLAVRLGSAGGTVELGGLLAGVGWLLALGALSAVLEIPGTAPVLTGWAFVLLLCHLICAQTGRVDESLLVLAKENRQPVKRILRLNNRILGSFSLLAVGAAALSLLFPLQNLANGLKALLLKAVRWLLSGIKVGDSPPPEPELAAAGGGLEAFVPEPPGEPSALMILLEKVLGYLVLGLLVLAAVYLLLYGAYRLYRRFYRQGRDDNGDMREFAGREKKEELSRRKGARRLLARLVPDQRERVRRIYYKRVRYHIRQGIKVREQDTAGEIARHISHREDLGELTARYNRARYGPGE